MDGRGLVDSGRTRSLREEGLWDEIRADLLNHPVAGGRDSVLYTLTTTSPAEWLARLTGPRPPGSLVGMLSSLHHQGKIPRQGPLRGIPSPFGR